MSHKLENARNSLNYETKTSTHISEMEMRVVLMYPSSDFLSTSIGSCSGETKDEEKG